MFRNALRIAAAFVVAVGLFAAPADAFAKRAPKKAEPSKTQAKKSDKKPAAKASAKRAPERASKRSKNGGDDARSRAVASKRPTAAKRDVPVAKRDTGRDVRRAVTRDAGRDAKAIVASAPKSQTAERVAVMKSDDADDAEEDDAPETAGPRPANRTVSSINPARVAEIQSALTRAGVYSGLAMGVYDQATFNAMSAFQARNGFDSTGMPTARALRALGVRKNSGVGVMTPKHILDTTSPSPGRSGTFSSPAAPAAATSEREPQMSSPRPLVIQYPSNASRP